MHEIAAFIGATAALITDPLAVAGYIIAGATGAVLRKYWLALAIASTWSIAIGILVAAQWGDLSSLLLAPRAVGAAIVSSVVFLMVKVFLPKPTPTKDQTTQAS